MRVVYSTQKNSFLFLKARNQILEMANLCFKGRDSFLRIFNYVDCEMNVEGSVPLTLSQYDNHSEDIQ